jgi:hypothetical protein
VVTSGDVARSIASATGQSQPYTASPEDLEHIVELPSPIIRGKMGEAVVQTTQPTETDPAGNNHEEGGVFGTDKNGNEIVAEAKSGPRCGSSECEIPVLDSQNPDIKNAMVDKDNQTTISGTYHTHPKGPATAYKSGTTLGTKMGDDGPSGPDLTVAKQMSDAGIVKGNSYVLDVHKNKVSVYNRDGVKATFPLDKFTKIGIVK